MKLFHKFSYIKLVYTMLINYRLFFIVTLITFIFSLNANSQNCSKKKLADNEIKGNYDYRGQSMFKEINTGDSAVIQIVLYSKQNYRIFVVGEQKLGNIDYQIIVPRKKFSRIIKDIQPKKITIYKKDPHGFYLYDNNGLRIPVGEETIQDTIWARETTSIDEMVYDNTTSESPFWLATPNKTQLITIKVFVHPLEKKINGCIGVYVGREYSNVYQFRR